MMGAYAVLENGVEEPQGIAAPRMARGVLSAPAALKAER
jgi:hypothetical protein